MLKYDTLLKKEKRDGEQSTDLSCFPRNFLLYLVLSILGRSAGGLVVVNVSLTTVTCVRFRLRAVI